MGLDDREYMREVPIYRDLVGRSGGTLPPTAEGLGFAQPARRRRKARAPAQTRPWAWFLLGVVCALAAISYVIERRQTSQPGGQLPPAKPVVISRPAAPQAYPLHGPRSVTAGSILTVTGTLAAGVTGVVTVRARWQGGPWYTLSTAQSSGSGYRVRYELDRRGPVQIRIVMPNGDYAAGTIDVK